MCAMPSSGENIASATRNGNSPEQETFSKFFEGWVVEQDRHLQELVSAAKEHENGSRDGEDVHNNRDLGGVVDVVLEHYKHYYRAKASCAKLDVLAMLSPSWTSTLEDAFLWIGGWRPSMAFHLLYSKSGLQVEAQLGEFFRGLTATDLAGLSPAQLSRVDELHRRTLREERDMTEKMAKLQETVADASMVELSHLVSEAIRDGGRAAAETGEEDGRVLSTLVSKEEALVELLQMADDLRLRTLEGVVDILTPLQAVHFLIAAAELHLRLHDWGQQRDATRDPTI